MGILTEAKGEETPLEIKAPRPDGWAFRDEADRKNISGSRAANSPAVAKMEVSDFYGQVGEIILMAVTFM
jgi:hypothetical protein